MINKLEIIENKFEEISLKLSDPQVISNQSLYRSLMKEFSSLEDIVSAYREYKKTLKEFSDTREMINNTYDKEFQELLQVEYETLKQNLDKQKNTLKLMLIPKDPRDEKSVIVEIRAGAGGEEAALFVGVLFRMYSMYSENKGWRVEALDSNPTEIGGFKEVVFSIEGNGAYSRLKFESGVHRVQRVPFTESSGRIHTSTVTVAVLPEVEEVDVQINSADIEIDTFRASGAGGQHVNKTDSAIRLTHTPSGIVVTCQDERSQHKNRDKAMKILRSKLYDLALQEKESKVSQDRKNQVGTGDRSERIRTYNYPQGRVSDHRINLTLYRLESVLDGDMEEIIDNLITADQATKLSGQTV